MSPVYTIFYGTFIQLPRTPASSEPRHVLDINHGALWVSNESGRIEGFDWSVSTDERLHDLLRDKGWVAVSGDGEEERIGEKTVVRVVKASERRNGFFFPGFIDTHIHASQYPNSGVLGSSTLLDWLERYTFPLEYSYGDGSSIAPKVARTAYEKVIARTLSNGTTCAAYYATIHVPATNLLADLCLKRGQRAFIGRVCMDNPYFCPDYYRDPSAEESLAATEATITHIRSIDPEGRVVAPIITPRFAPTCTPVSLSGLGKLAASFEPPLRIQTHISENKNEVALVKELFPDSTSYAGVYDQHGLMTPRTILAHAVHLTPEERSLIHSRDAKISHCPASNSALGSGLCPVRTLLDDGIAVGLGTDVSGGYSPSVLEAVRQAILVSRLVSYSAEEQTGKENLSVQEALYLATRGGAKVVDMADQIGGFEVGMSWDAQLIELSSIDDRSAESINDAQGSVDIFGWETWEEKIQKWVWNGDDRNVKAVWVNGKLVHQRSQKEANRSVVHTAVPTLPRSWVSYLLRCAISNPNVSEAAKERDQAMLEEEYGGGSSQGYDASSSEEGEKMPQNVARGLKAAMHNPNVTDFGKKQARDKLQDMGGEPEQPVD
ncbi:chlorohydrolase family protein [Paecilomyces variotii No. 5]|uniref:Probable guanine deaminase n=1 Tax=Byssochlamys spectabilis (strain No. 5 / NBRC 109023) TaxID=1356009 RepID=V5FEC2_BYSSN|nr:chlorohydrolase family protein [Paecilomyces variotii No. 5]